jgi:hypothetical protein
MLNNEEDAVFIQNHPDKQRVDFIKRNNPELNNSQLRFLLEARQVVYKHYNQPQKHETPNTPTDPMELFCFQKKQIDKQLTHDIQHKHPTWTDEQVQQHLVTHYPPTRHIPCVIKKPDNKNNNNNNQKAADPLLTQTKTFSKGFVNKVLDTIKHTGLTHKQFALVANIRQSDIAKLQAGSLPYNSGIQQRLNAAIQAVLNVDED